MKIKEISNEGYVFTVTFKPNLIQRLFGLREKVEEYKKEFGKTYHYGSGGVYHTKEGKELGNWNKIGEAIDDWQRRF